MKFYSFDDIRQAADCADIAKHLLGLPLNRENRCAATWRGGKNPSSVHFTREGWHDFSAEQGGTVIDLVAMLKFSGDIQQAQEFLGEYLHLQPKMQTRQTAEKTKYEKLIEDGYKEISRDNYTDLDGNVVHFEVRLEHPTKGKTFLQGTPSGWGLKNIEPILYNLAGITASPWCCIVEGPKDANRLIALGIPATTCAGGAKKWSQSYAKTFHGKSVAILPDNDDVGIQHAKIIAASIVNTATDVRIVMTSNIPKGDVSDWLDEGHTANELMELISTADKITATDVVGIEVPRPDTPQIKEVKQANSIPFRNFIPVKQAPDPNKKKRKNAKAEDDIVKKPRAIMDMVQDIHRRFLGFPRKVGEQLFDHDKDTGEIYYMKKSSALFGWIGRKSKHPVEWEYRGASMCKREDFFESIIAEAYRYEAISSIPDWPRRNDVYYIHPEIPAPSEYHAYFNKMIDFFTPATPEDRNILKAFFAAPLWYIKRIQRPSWIIDSEDGQGTGKTTIVEACAHLYDSEPVRTGQTELKFGMQEITKRLLCANGRNARILLIDNVVGTFASPTLADMITSWSISGKRPYGKGEETRPNNLVYAITANNATVDTDIASRSFYVFVKRPQVKAGWKDELLRFIERNRYQIIADIIDIIENHEPFSVPVQTRFAEFEQTILQPMCETQDAYLSVLKHITAKRSESNIEEEQAKAFEEMFRGKLIDLGIDPDNDSVWIRSQVVNSWGRLALMDTENFKGMPIQLIRSLAKQRLLKIVDPKIKRWPFNSKDKTSGIFWNRKNVGIPNKENNADWQIIKNSNGDAEKRMV